MDNARRVLQSHNSVNSISSGIVNRIRAQLSQHDDPIDAKDKWRLDSPIESGRVLRITREMAPKPDGPVELNHVPRWKRQKFLFDTETGVLTPFDDDDGDDDKESDQGEWMVFDEQGFVAAEAASRRALPLAQAAAETGTPAQQARLVVQADKAKAQRSSIGASEAAVGLGASVELRTAEVDVALGAGRTGNLGRRVSVLEAKETLYRKVFAAALVVAAVALTLYFATKRLANRPHTS